MAYIIYNRDDHKHHLQLDDTLNHVQYLGHNAIRHLDIYSNKIIQPLAALLSTNSGWVLVTPFSPQNMVNGEPISSIKMLYHQDTFRINNIEMQIMTEVVTILDENSPAILKGLTCPGHLGKFLVGDSVVLCPNCKKVHSLEAWLEFSRCSALHCNYRIRMTAGAIDNEPHS